MREPEDSERRETTVKLDTNAGDGSDAFEREVRRAATQVVRALEAGLRVALATSHETIEPDAGARQRTRLLSFLARVRPGRPAERSAPQEPPAPEVAA